MAYLTKDQMFQRFLHLELEAFPIIDVFHALANARDFQKNVAPQPLVQLFVAFCMFCLGGSSMTAIMLGQPLGWMSSDRTFLVYVSVFVLANAPLTRGLFRAIVNAPIISTLISAMDDWSWANSVVNVGAQKALHPVHADNPIKNSATACILLGILSGCGGGMIRSALNFNNSSWSFSAPKHFTGPTWPLGFTALLSFTYYLLLNPHNLLPYMGLQLTEAKWSIILLTVGANTGFEVLKSLSNAVIGTGTSKSKRKVAEKSGSSRKKSRSASSSASTPAIVESDDNEDSPPVSAAKMHTRTRSKQVFPEPDEDSLRAVQQQDEELTSAKKRSHSRRTSDGPNKRK